jgi:hypothetical protein
MSQSLRPDFSILMADMLYSDIQFRRNNYYYVIGKVDPWGFPDDQTNENIDLTYTPEKERLFRSNLVFAKKVNPTDISITTKRYDWVEGQTYIQWDHTKDLRTSAFYVLTDEFNVYKCLDNAGSSESTVKPTGKLLTPLRTADGYLWKYMYTIPAYKRARFTSPASIPVQRAVSDTFYNRGTIKEVIVLEQGSGYDDQQLVTLSVSGSVSGSGAVATVNLGPIGNILSLTVVDGGTGYTKGVKVNIIGNGAGAIVNAIIDNGTTGGPGIITGFTVVEGGVSYDEFSTVVFTLGGAELLPVISRTTGSFEGVIIINPGIGYNGDPTVTIIQQTSTGTGKYVGNSGAIIQLKELDGRVDRAVIVDPGLNYEVDTATTIAVNGDGENAVFSPVIYQERLIGVLVENPGVNYTNISLSVQSAVGSGAVVQAVVEQSDYTSEQMIVEQTTVPGAIHKVEVVNQGSAYSAETYITIQGNGNGCIAIPIIEDGKIVDIKVDSPGSGYTVAIVTIVDPERDEEILPEEFKATAYAIMSPVGGHGKDAITELYGDEIIINSELRSDIVKYNVDQDFRTFGIIESPKNAFTGSDYNKLDNLIGYSVTFDTTADLVKDEILISSSFNKYVVLEILGTEVLLSPLECMCTEPIGILTVIGSDPIKEYTVLNTNSVSDFDKYSGKLLYVSAETPFVFTEDQSITIKTYIKF